MSESQRPKRILQSIGGVFAGLLTIIVLSIGSDITIYKSGIFPQWDERAPDTFLALATAYRSLYAIAGSYIAARLAPRRPMLHALVLGAIGLLLSTVGAMATWNGGPAFEPKWYPLALIVIAMPCAWIGGRLREMQQSLVAAGMRRQEPADL